MRRRTPLSQLPSVPSGQPLDIRRYAYMIPWLQRSGARAVPLPSERPYVVLHEATQRLITPDTPAPIDQAPSLTKLFPWLFAPLESFPIVTASTIQTIAAGATVTLITLTQLPHAHAGVINAFGCAAADFTVLNWSFVVRGRLMQPIVNLNFQYGPLNDPKALPGSGVLLNPLDDFNVQVQNTSAGGVAGVQARIEGYYWRIGAT